MEEIAAARRFAPAQSVVQIYGTCEACRTGPATRPIDGATTELVFARDALRIAIATERSGLEFYTRAAALTRDPRGRTVFQKLADEEQRAPGHARGALRASCSRRTRSSSRGRRSCSSRARRTACSPRAPSSCATGVDDQQALLIGIRCERGSHKFFKRYGERFEDSEGKQIFLEFADEEREHLDLLIREYRALRSAGPPARRARPPRAAVDRPPHPHDRVRRAVHARRARRPRGRGRRHRAERHRSRHDRRLRGGRGRVRGRRRRVRARHRDHRDPRRRRRARARIFRRPARPPCCAFLAEQRRGASTASARCSRAWRRSASRSTPRRSCGRAFDDRSRAIGRPWIARALVDGGPRRLARAKPSTAGCRAGGPRSCRASARRPTRSSRACTRRAASPRSRIRACSAATSGFPSFADAGLDALEVFHTDHDALATTRYLAMAVGWDWPCRAARTFTRTRRTAPPARAASRCRPNSSSD